MKTIGACVLAFFISGCGCNIQPGEGRKIGQIVKVSYEGILRNTWEAQMIRGGFSDGSGTLGTAPFDFTIDDSALVAKAQEFMQNQTEVIVKYRREGFYHFMRSGAGMGSFAISIEPAKK